MKDERLSGLAMICIESDMARRLDMTDVINTQNRDKVHKFVVFWTILTIQDEVCCEVSLYKKCQQQSCSAINCLSSGINILAGG